MAKIVGKPNADDVKRVAVAALVAALDDSKESAKKNPRLTGMRAVATGAVLYTAGKVAFNGRRFISERLQGDGQPEEDEAYDEDEDLEDDDDEEAPVAVNGAPAVELVLLDYRLRPVASVLAAHPQPLFAEGDEARRRGHRERSGREYVLSGGREPSEVSQHDDRDRTRRAYALRSAVNERQLKSGSATVRRTPRRTTSGSRPFRPGRARAAPPIRRAGGSSSRRARSISSSRPVSTTRSSLSRSATGRAPSPSPAGAATRRSRATASSR